MPNCLRKKHFSCRNCKSIVKYSFANNVIFCFGLVRKPNPKQDAFRFCIARNKTRNVTDIMEEELILLLHGLSTILTQFKLNKLNGK